MRSIEAILIISPSLYLHFRSGHTVPLSCLYPVTAPSFPPSLLPSFPHPWPGREVSPEGRELRVSSVLACGQRFQSQREYQFRSDKVSLFYRQEERGGNVLFIFQFVKSPCDQPDGVLGREQVALRSAQSQPQLTRSSSVCATCELWPLLRLILASFLKQDFDN